MREGNAQTGHGARTHSQRLQHPLLVLPLSVDHPNHRLGRCQPALVPRTPHRRLNVQQRARTHLVPRLRIPPHILLHSSDQALHSDVHVRVAPLPRLVLYEESADVREQAPALRWLRLWLAFLALSAFALPAFFS